MNNHRSSSVPQRKGPGQGPGAGPLMLGGGKAKNFKSTIFRLCSYFAAVKAAFIFVIVITVIATFSMAITPKILASATNSISTTALEQNIYTSLEQRNLLKDLPDGVVGEAYKNLPSEFLDGLTNNQLSALKSIDTSKGSPLKNMAFGYISNILIVCTALYSLSSVFQFLQAYVMSGVTQKMIYKMRNDVKMKLSRLPMKYFDSNSYGDILSRVTNDIDNISNTMQQSIIQIISSVITVVSIFIVMLTINLWLTLITVAALPMIVLASTIIVKKAQKEFKINQRSIGEMSGHIEEMYTGHKIISAYSKESDAIEEFNKINKRLLRAGWRSQFLSGVIMPISHLINNIGYLTICVAGGVLSINNSINVGEIIAFTQYSRNFTQPINQIANIINILQSAAASAERVFEIMDEPEELKDAENATTLTNPKGCVVFEHVKFGYNDNKILINDLNLTVEAGKTVAIVGPTGAGKTTIINLLMRFYELNGGSISIDGVNIKDIKRENLRSLFGMVLQDTWLFSGPIRKNIAYGKEGSTPEEIIKAAEAAYADNFIRTLPHGYNTVINEDANNISGGQKQLLTIARAIVSNPTILILDEATSSVDTRTEMLIQTAMNKLMSGRTSFVIAHRLSTIKNADVILVLKHGDIVETGNHKDLMDKKGFYYELYNSQFAGLTI